MARRAWIKPRLYDADFWTHNESMIYGYARVSTAAQDETGQVSQLKAAGWEKVFPEKVTGTTADRPQLRALMKKLAPDDVVITPAVDRLSRDTTDLLVIARDMQRAGAGIRSLTEPVLDTTVRFWRYHFRDPLALPRSWSAAGFWSALRAAGLTPKPTASIRPQTDPYPAPAERSPQAPRRRRDARQRRRSYNVSHSTISRLTV
jgi:Resolvase, N terminal domain